MTAPAAVGELVERFDSHRDAYRSGQYNETQLRRDFLDPLFAAFGWDVHNRQGYAEAYREVIHEDAIKIGGRTKAPDYCFRVGGGVRSFFVEAKKPSVDIRDALSPAYQLPGCPEQTLTFEGGPHGFADNALRLVVAWPQNPSGWRSHRRHLLGVLSLLRNPDTFSDKAHRGGYAYCGKVSGPPASGPRA